MEVRGRGYLILGAQLQRAKELKNTNLALEINEDPFVKVGG